MTEQFTIPERLYFHSDKVAEQKHGEKQAYGKDNIEQAVSPEEANLIGSLCANGMHAPVIDFDYPIEVIPSTSMGHYHLYIHKEIDWWRYKMLLRSLSMATLIERGYANASINKGMSAVRPPGVQKLEAPEVSGILADLAVTKRRNFELEMQIQNLEKQVALLQEKITVPEGDTPCKFGCGYTSDDQSDLNYHYFSFCPLAKAIGV